MGRRLVVSSIVLAIVTMLLAPGATQAVAASGASLCNGPRDAQGVYVTRCFSPAGRSRAESLLTFIPVHVDRAVASVVPLHLAQIAVTRATVPHTGGSATEIAYVFGTIPRGPHDEPMITGPGLGQYVIVQEDAGHNPNLARFAEVRQVNQGTYWQVHAAFRCHRADLLVTSDEPKGTVRRVARAILVAERCGKSGYR